MNIEELKNYLPDLKSYGRKGLFRCLCPFHKEKTPSFTINPLKKVYYCFGCKKGGRIEDIPNQIQGVTITNSKEGNNKPL